MKIKIPILGSTGSIGISTLNIIDKKKKNDNVFLSVSSGLDLKNNNSPLSQTIKLSIFDECSKLDISYTDKRFNDNYNTQPSEIINLSFRMDYLGFFGYEQKSNVFFEETGDFNYGY